MSSPTARCRNPRSPASHPTDALRLVDSLVETFF